MSVGNHRAKQLNGCLDIAGEFNGRNEHSLFPEDHMLVIQNKENERQSCVGNSKNGHEVSGISELSAFRGKALYD